MQIFLLFLIIFAYLFRHLSTTTMINDGDFKWTSMKFYISYGNLPKLKGLTSINTHFRNTNRFEIIVVDSDDKSVLVRKNKAARPVAVWKKNIEKLLSFTFVYLGNENIINLHKKNRFLHESKCHLFSFHLVIKSE